MRIRYENTFDDYMAFQDHFGRTSRAFKRQVGIWTWGGAASVFLCLLLLTSVKSPDGPLALKLFAATLAAAVYVVYYRYSVRGNVRKMAKKLYEEGANRTFEGWHELEALPEGLLHRSAYTEGRIAWGAIESIESAPGHVYLMISSTSAIILPRNGVKSADLSAFLAEVGKHYRPGATLSAPAAEAESVVASV
jgi:hypothetical protein